ncbi:MAG TPA: hypothetical protein PK970_00615 [Hyphomicrobiaceae bacterium]|nr:hypothetical protein [Hyphomicrobiaceae bacterium]
MEQITKHDGTRRQISAAIRLMFDGGDLLAVHTIAWAAYCVATDVAKGTTGPRHAPPADYYQKYLAGYDRDMANFLKHADRDPCAVLFEPPPGSTDFLIEAAIEAFETIGGIATNEMSAFRSVVALKRGQWRDDDKRREDQYAEDRQFERALDDAESDEERDALYRDRDRRACAMDRAYAEVGRQILAGTHSFLKPFR